MRRRATSAQAGARHHLLENGAAPGLKEPLLKAAAGLTVPVLGITGTGGAGKSSLTDELVRRFRLDQGTA
jgi:methylmalonyl-CoA mutase